MKKFRVFEHPDNRLEAVKEGFSFPGFFFTGLWFLWHKMWVPGSIAIIVALGVYIVFPSPFGHYFGIADITNFVIEVIVGIFGNEWRSSSLKERGFEIVMTVMAATPDDAKAKYLRNHTTKDSQTSIEHTVDLDLLN
jgi:hypothetical protein